MSTDGGASEYSSYFENSLSTGCIASEDDVAVIVEVFLAAYCFLSLDVGERLLLSSQTGVTSGMSLLILEQAIINFIFLLVSSRASGVRWIPLY